MPRNNLFHDNFVVVCQSILQIVACVIDSRSVCVGFVVDEVALKDVFLLILWLLRAPNLHTLSFDCHLCYVVLAIDSVVK